MRDATLIDRGLARVELQPPPQLPRLRLPPRLQPRLRHDVLCARSEPFRNRRFRRGLDHEPHVVFEKPGHEKLS